MKSPMPFQQVRKFLLDLSTNNYSHVTITYNHPDNGHISVHFFINLVNTFHLLKSLIQLYILLHKLQTLVQLLTPYLH